MVILSTSSQTMIHFAVQKAFSIMQYIQCAALAVTDAIRGTSQTKLGLESLRSQRWFRHLCTYSYQTMTNIFKYSFFPYSTMEWNKLSSSIRNSTYPVFRKPVSNPVYNIQNYISLRSFQLTSLRLGLNHLINEHRFNHNFQNCINLLCTYSLEVESTASTFLLALPPLP